MAKPVPRNDFVVLDENHKQVMKTNTLFGGVVFAARQRCKFTTMLAVQDEAFAIGAQVILVGDMLITHKTNKNKIEGLKTLRVTLDNERVGMEAEETEEES